MVIIRTRILFIILHTYIPESLSARSIQYNTIQFMRLIASFFLCFIKVYFSSCVAESFTLLSFLFPSLCSSPLHLHFKIVLFLLYNIFISLFLYVDFYLLFFYASQLYKPGLSSSVFSLINLYSISKWFFITCIFHLRYP